MSTQMQAMKHAPEIINVIVVALYEPDSGRIVHTHIVTMMKGGRVVPEKEAIDGAHKHATRSGLAVERLKMKISSNPLHAKRPHRVDPNTGEFVPIPRPDVKSHRSPNSAV